MGTLSKAIGGYGGYLCASDAVIAVIDSRANAVADPACVHGWRPVVVLCVEIVVGGGIGGAVKHLAGGALVDLVNIGGGLALTEQAGFEDEAETHVADLCRGIL